MKSPTVSIVGAGPTGALLSILMRRRGYGVRLFDARPDPRLAAHTSGRSINLALADRGIHALREVGLYDSLQADMVPMRGRMVHDLAGGITLQPYGSRAAEQILSISRHRLSAALLHAAIERYGVEAHFEHRLEGVDCVAGFASLRTPENGAMYKIPLSPLLACDGGGSRVRHALQSAGLIEVLEQDLAHGYKELTIPPRADGSFALAPEALHIWPRGSFMLIALPNTDASFTATLFLANHGSPGFKGLQGEAAVEEFLQSQFPDAAALMPERISEFLTHPTGFLGTVYASPWHDGGRVALIGDAAHAIVPFHGQGMNCCFEDCVAFDACCEEFGSWDERFAAFYARRKPNADAIAAMALDNYLEMRDRVAEPRFQLQRALALELERRHPRHFIPRYSMVMFHHEIPYAVAQQRGAVQQQLLEDLTDGKASLAEVDYEAAERMVRARLAPLD